MSMQGKTAVITGAGRGLGRSLALAFAAKGCRLALISRTREELEAVAEETGLGSGDCLIRTGDLSDPAVPPAFIAEAAERLQGIDILMNNAAVIGPPRFLDHEAPETWSRTLDIDLRAPAELCREALPGMLERGDGVIINITSGLARMAFPRFSAYCAAKAGLEQLTRCLAEEYPGSGVFFYALDPGVMDTSMQEAIRSFSAERLTPELKRQFQDMKDEGHLQSPDKTAELALALAEQRPWDMNGRAARLKDLPNLVRS